MAQGAGITDVENLQRIWDSLGVLSPPEWFRRYIAAHPDQPGMAFDFSLITIAQIVTKSNQDWDISKARSRSLDWSDEYEKALGEALRHLRRVMHEHPDILLSVRNYLYANPKNMALAADWLATGDDSAISSI